VIDTTGRSFRAYINLWHFDSSLAPNLEAGDTLYKKDMGRRWYTGVSITAIEAELAKKNLRVAETADPAVYIINRL
jgi:hypothetical protein